jgi:glycosyltransferase involved in cell wall biosynthesis
MAHESRKVLFLTPSLTDGGAERVLSILLRHLDRNRFSPHLAVLQEEGTYMREVPADVPIHNLRVRRARYALPAVVKLVRSLRPHTVISSLRNMNLLLLLSRQFLPRHTKVVVRESATATPTLKSETGFPRVWKGLYRHLYKRADHVVGLSNVMVRDLVENFEVPEEKAVRIYNPIDSRHVRIMADQGDSPFCGEGPNLVTAARLSREKGIDILLDALPAVVRRFPTAELVILGEGPEREPLERQARLCGLLRQVRFPGFDPNPWRYFRHADLFVLPSRYEGLPNALLEALAVGTQVIATDCLGGIREIQTCDPDMKLVPPEDPDALAQAMIEALSKAEDRKGRHNRAVDLSKFGLQKALHEYSRLF